VAGGRKSKKVIYKDVGESGERKRTGEREEETLSLTRRRTWNPPIGEINLFKRYYIKKKY